MATFEQQYEELFGKKLNYDPVKSGGEEDLPPNPHLNLTQGGDTAPDEFQTNLDSLYDSITQGKPTPQPESTGMGERYVKALASGVGQTGEMALGAGEYGARQAAENFTGAPREMATDVASGLATARRWMQQKDQNLIASMTPDVQAQLQKQILTLDPDKSIWRGGPGETLDAIAMQFTQALPATILTLLPAARWFRAGMTPGALLYLGASEGTLSVGQVANGIANEVENMTDDQLKEGSPVFRQLLQQGESSESARERLINAAQNNAPLLAGLMVGAISASAGRWLEPVFSTEGMPLARRFVTGFSSEALQEAPQSAIEQYAQNVAAHTFDPNQNPWDQVLEQGAQGLLIGGLSGGAFAGVAGHGVRHPVEAHTSGTSEAGATPGVNFDEVFGKGPEQGFNLEPPPGRVLNSNITVEDAPGGVPADIRAVLEEGGQQKMYLPQPGELEQMGRQNTLPLGPNDFTTKTAGTPAVPLGQLPLPMQRRVQGGMEGVGGAQPLPAAVNYAPDMTNPTGRYQNPRQGEMMPSAEFEQGQAPDHPSAEPFADLMAQVQEMERPESDRQGVYLSPDNIEMLRQSGNLDQLLEHGVVLANFDGKGGALIARDRTAADELLKLRNQGAGNMQEILGLATTAGTGKPATNTQGIVVQRRDHAGNVVQESLVANEQEGEALAAQWERRYPNFDVQILTAPAAIGRRNVRIQQEQEKSARRQKLEARKQAQVSTSQQVRQATAILPSEAPVEQLGTRETARRAAEGATTPVKAAARLIGQATRESAPMEQKRVGGFYPPEALEFKDERERVRYENRFRELVDAELAQELISREQTQERNKLRRKEIGNAAAEQEFAERSAAQNEAKKRSATAREELAQIRERAKPIRKATRYVEAARRLAPEAVSKLSSEARVTATLEPEDQTTKPAVEVNTEQLGKLTPSEISKLSGDKLQSVFEQAATWFAGRIQEGHTTTVPFTSDVENLQAFAEKYVPPANRQRMQGARLYDKLIERLKSPSLQKRFINRVSNLVRRRQFGGKTQSKPITKSSVQSRQNPSIQKRKSKFNTQVLAGDVLPQDESPSDRIKREADARRTREHLDRTIRRSQATLEKFSAGKFSNIANERTEEGVLTERAKDLIHGRAYFRYLIDFATALHKSGNKGRPVINEMAKVDEFLSNAAKMPVDDFARVMGRLLRAESHQQITELRNFGEFKSQLANPETRDEANAEILQELMADEARRTRLEERWRQNPYYNSIVEPLMDKITDSTLRTDYPSYKPTEDEMLRLQWVMDNWRADPKTREAFYDPLRRFFTLVGFEWTPTKRDGSGGRLIIPYTESTAKGERGRHWVGEGENAKPMVYRYSLPDRALLPLFRKKFGTQDEDLSGIRLGGPAEYVKPRVQLPPEARRGFLPRPSRFEQLGRQLQANRVIAKFRSLIEKSKITVAGMIRTEERLIRAFKELGMWTDVSPVLGSVKFDKAMTYRPVGPRLAEKAITKEEARKLLLQQMKQQPIEADWATYRGAIPLGERPLSAESELFLEHATEVGPSIEQFRRTGLQVQRMLSDQSRITTLGDVLNVIGQGIPESHLYNRLAQRLLAVPSLSETPISWDWRGQLSKEGSKILGATKWETDLTSPSGIFRYVLLHNERINTRAEPQAVLLHTLLHEAVHVATAGALDTNRGVYDAMKQLQTIARRFMRNEGGRMEEHLPYGLRDLHPVHEFVAEAFSNLHFQEMLKQIRFDRVSSLWQKFTSIVKRILGVHEGQNEPKNAFEAVMSMQHRLFTGENRVQKAAALSMESVDPVIRPIAQDVAARISSIGPAFQQMWQRSHGLNAPLIAMTMRQIHKEFRRHFGAGKNSLDRYLEGWENRNAENSRLMEEGERVSRAWTSATENTSTEKALEFSRIFTEASLYGIHPDVPPTATQNAHIKSEEQKARARELYQRFGKLEPEWQALYKRIRGYYSQTLNREIDLLMVNALRGVLATGDKAIMSRADFDKKYSEDNVRKLGLTTKEGLEKEFGSLDKPMLRTLQEIASIPQQREGPYAPLMRYGDYVVYGQKLAETKTFSDSKEAFKYRADKLAGDPTLDVNVKETGEGKYTVYTTERDFRTAESPTEAEQLKQEMIEEYGREAVTDVQLKDTFMQEQSLQSGSALASVLTALSGNASAQNAVKNFWLRSLADRSFRKHQIRRKQRRGVDFDLQHRNFTNYVKQASYYTSQLKFGWRMADAFREMQKYVRASRDTPEISSVRLGQIVEELHKRDEMTSDMETASRLIRRGAEVGQLYMLFGPSYWLINLTQPYMVTLPWLGARYGWGGASSALASAQKLIAHPLLSAAASSWGGVKALVSKAAAERAFNVLDQVKDTIKKRGGDRADAYIKMLEELRQQSVIDLSWIAELRDISEGRETTKFQKVMDATRVMGHLTEVNNRIVSALAAYDLRYNEVMARQGATHELAHTAAVQTAKDAVAETQFDYSGGNKARLFTRGGPAGKAAPLVFQFMQWPQHMYAMMISNMAAAVNQGTIDRRTAIKTLAGLFATHAAATGVLGITLQPLKWAIGLALMALGGSDQPYDLSGAISGENFDRATRSVLADMLGNEMGAVAAQGLPEMAGARLTDRMSLGTVYYLDLKTDTAESTFGSLLSGFGGPLVSLGFNGWRAAQYMGQGDLYRGIETLMPKGFRDIMRAYRYSADGVVNNAGDTVVQTDGVSPYQVFLQAMGFTPAAISDFYSKQAIIKDTEKLGADRRDSLLKRFRNATTAEARNSVLRDVAEFNRQFPAAAVTRSALLRALTAKAEREVSYRNFGASLRGRDRIYAQEGEFYDTE